MRKQLGLWRKAMNKRLLQRFSQYELTKSQIRIADYIGKNQKRVLGMTAKELGQEVDVSDATIIRFARTVGFEGYTQLQEFIEKELKEHNEKIGKHSLHDRYVMQFERYNETESTSEEMIRLMSSNLENSIRQNQEELYKKISVMILDARKKVVIGLRGGKGPAVQFARLAGLITNNVRALISEGHDDIRYLLELDENDVVIFLSFPRYYTIDEKITTVLAERRVPIILITDSMTNPLTRYAKEVLLVETEHCGFFHSMIGVEGVLEYILILMCWRNPEEFREKLEQRDAVLNDYLINAGK